MSTQGSSANLAQAAKTLVVEWENTKTYWRDVKSQEFERSYLADLPGQVNATISAMGEMEQLLKKIRSDCE